jgi:hypothetical protein
MKTKPAESNTDRAATLFGKFASDPLAHRVFATVALWPTFDYAKAKQAEAKSRCEKASAQNAQEIAAAKSLKEKWENAEKEFGEYQTDGQWIGNYASVVRWKPGPTRATNQRDARQTLRKHPCSPEEIRRIGQRMHEREQRRKPSLKELLDKHCLEARIHPAIEQVLDILIPALCKQDAKPFTLFADAIEAQKSAGFPDNELAFTTWQLACKVSGHPMPFMATGEPADTVMEQPKDIRVPVLSESDLRREVEKRLGRERDSLNPGAFTKLLRRLRITCRYSPKSGGRGRKVKRVLPRRTSKQKPG